MTDLIPNAPPLHIPRGGTGIRLDNHPEILLTLPEYGDDEDQIAGLEGHPATFYCTAPDTFDVDAPALAAGTILSCRTDKPNPNPFNTTSDNETASTPIAIAATSD